MAIAEPPQPLWTLGKPPAVDCPPVRTDVMSRIAATKNPLIFEARSFHLEPGLVQQTVDARRRTCVSVHCVSSLPKTWPYKAIKAITGRNGLTSWGLQGSERQKTGPGLAKEKIYDPLPESFY